MTPSGSSPSTAAKPRPSTASAGGQPERGASAQLARGDRPRALDRVQAVERGVAHVVEQVAGARHRAEGGEQHRALEDRLQVLEPAGEDDGGEDEEVLRPLGGPQGDEDRSGGRPPHVRCRGAGCARHAAKVFATPIRLPWRRCSSVRLPPTARRRSPSPASSGLSRAAELAILALIVVIGCALRARALGQSLFGDELFTYEIVTGRSLGDVIDGINSTELNPPLYFVLAWLAAKIGDPLIWIRVPSLVFATAAIPLVWLVGRRTVGRNAALLGAALLRARAVRRLLRVRGARLQHADLPGAGVDLRAAARAGRELALVVGGVRRRHGGRDVHALHGRLRADRPDRAGRCGSTATAGATIACRWPRPRSPTCPGCRSSARTCRSTSSRSSFRSRRGTSCAARRACSRGTRTRGSTRCRARSGSRWCWPRSRCGARRSRVARRAARAPGACRPRVVLLLGPGGRRDDRHRPVRLGGPADLPAPQPDHVAAGAVPAARAARRARAAARGGWSPACSWSPGLAIGTYHGAQAENSRPQYKAAAHWVDDRAAPAIPSPRCRASAPAGSCATRSASTSRSRTRCSRSRRRAAALAAARRRGRLFVITLRAAGVPAPVPGPPLRWSTKLFPGTTPVEALEYAAP